MDLHSLFSYSSRLFGNFALSESTSRASRTHGEAPEKDDEPGIEKHELRAYQIWKRSPGRLMNSGMADLRRGKYGLGCFNGRIAAMDPRVVRWNKLRLKRINSVSINKDLS